MFYDMEQFNNHIFQTFRIVCVDEYMQDQMIIFMALAKGESKMLAGPLTLHSQTAIHIAIQLTEAKFCVSPIHTGTNRQTFITCHGIGYQ